MSSRPPIPSRFGKLSSFSKGAPQVEKSSSQNQPPMKDKKMDGATCNELRRKNLCFICKSPSEPNHYCMGKGQIHYIEVVSDGEEDSDLELDLRELDFKRLEVGCPTPPNKDICGGTITTIFGTFKYLTIKVQRTSCGDVILLIDGGATHNFVDERFVAKKNLQVVEF